MEVKNLNKIYKTEYELVHALDDMSLKFPDHGLVFIVGVSGSGKSTLMNMLSGVDVPTSGEVIVNNKSLFKESKNELFGYRNSYVGLIFQEYNLIEDMNVYDNIKLPLELLGITDFSIIEEVIKKVDIEDIKYSNINEISSGQMQRVAIARALVKNSSIILADEPTGNLDSRNTKVVMDLLKEISKTRLVVVITHDDEAANEYGDEIIAIEDGKILDNIIKDESINTVINENKNVEFINPKIKLKKQLLFTKNFIMSNITRSLAIFLLMILVPFIGNILCGYLFFDIDTSYSAYQEEYGSEFVKIADQSIGYEVNYSEDNYLELYDRYNNSSLIEVYGINYHVDLEDHNESINEFYQKQVNNLIIDDGHFKYLEGRSPLKASSAEEAQENKDKVAITDYFQASYKFYRGEEIGLNDQIEINGVIFTICGIVNTTYEKYIDFDQTDLFISMAFQENLEYYNAFYVSVFGYNYWMNNMTYYEEYGKFTMNTTIPATVKYENILIRKYDIDYAPTIYRGNSLASYSTSQGLVSYDLWTDLLNKNINDSSIYSFAITFVCSVRTKYTFGFRTTGMYYSNNTDYNNQAKYEIIVPESLFQKNLDKQNGCKFLVRTSDSNYKKILLDENVVNQSFTFAKATWSKADDSKYVMIEFILTLMLITAVFAFVINSMTMNIEKKKIGIKYSFGITKRDIIIPYILELLIYIGLGFILSLLLTKVIYPLIVNGLIYTTPQEIKEYYFYYIGLESILGWDLVIYFIMLISLLIMVYKICKKSPIEIIKDL